MRTGRRYNHLLLAVAIALFASGCGGDDDTTARVGASPDGPNAGNSGASEASAEDVSTTTYSFQTVASNDVTVDWTLELAPPLQASDPGLPSVWSGLTSEAPSDIDCLANGTTEAVFVGRLTIENDSGFNPDPLWEAFWQSINSDSDLDQIGWVGAGVLDCQTINGPSPLGINLGTGTLSVPIFFSLSDIYGPSGTDTERLVDRSDLRMTALDIRPGTNTVDAEEFVGEDTIEMTLPYDGAGTEAAAVPEQSESPETGTSTTFDEFSGSWTGAMTEPNGAQQSYDFTLSLDYTSGVLTGETVYPSYGCEGRLENPRLEGTTLYVDETITLGPCGETTLQLELDGESLVLTGTAPNDTEVVETATLYRD